MAKRTKPKPCPFCGSADVKVQLLDNDSFGTQCNGCLATGPWAGYYAKRAGAIKTWNKRADETARAQQSKTVRRKVSE